MLRAIVFLAVAGCSLRTSAQPAACESDQHCQSGFYCMPDAFLCAQCLDCKDLKRDPPRVPTACIRSVAECGFCIKGYVDDLRGDVTAECVVEAGEAAGGGALPAWAWAAVTLGPVLFVMVVAATVWYLLRNTNTFKILASTRTSVRSPGLVESAPEAPPPYRAHYNNHQDLLNNHNHQHLNNHNHQDLFNNQNHQNDHDSHDTDTDNCAWRDHRDHRDLLPHVVDPSAPCDDGSPEVSPQASPRAVRKHRVPPRGPREAAARQATRVYTPPNYVRPPRYSEADASSPASPAPEPPSLHDEDTMESTWTAAALDDNENANAAGGGEQTELLAAARLNDQRHHQYHHAPHHHHLPCTQDTNNNRSEGAPAGADPSGSASAGSAPRGLPHGPVSFIINVVQNMQNRT